MEAKFEPFISIIIPIYNGELYLNEAIDSALGQTYKNIEIVIVNDGSKDRTVELVEKYGNKVRFFSKPNGGVATALNKAISEAKGQYISWLSHDDVYFPDKLEKQVKELNKLPAKERLNTILYTNYTSINEKSVQFGASEFHLQYPADKLNHPHFPLFSGLVHGCTLLIPKHCFDEVGLFDPKLRATQDYALWFKMFPRYQVRFMPDQTVRSRVHAGQDSRKHTSNVECDALWINMVSSVSKEEMNFMFGGRFAFYQTILKVVTGANYTGAVEFLEKKLQEYRERAPEQIKISVIMPFYNRIDYTLESIKSVIAQTHKNWEIILIDDGSTENITPINKLAKKEPRIKLFSNSRNSGPAKSRNLGISKASGEYIAFLDSDDMFIETKLETQLKFMLANNCLVSHTSYELFTDAATGGNTTEMHSGRFSYTLANIVTNCQIATPAVMAHEDVFTNAKNRFPETMKIGEDTCLWINIAHDYEIKGIDQVLTKVRKHDKQAAYNPKLQIQGLRNILDYCLENFGTEQIVKGQIYALNQDLCKYTNEAYELKPGVLVAAPAPAVPQESMTHKVKRQILKLIAYLPHYRKMIHIEEKLNHNQAKFSELEQKLDKVIEQKNSK